MAVLIWRKWRGIDEDKDWQKKWKARKDWVGTKLDGHEVVKIRRTFWKINKSGFGLSTEMKIEVSEEGTEISADGTWHMSDAEINQFHQAIIEAKWALALLKEPEDPIRLGRDLTGLMKSWLMYYEKDEESRPFNFIGPEFKGLTISDIVRELDEQTPLAFKFVENWTRIFFSFSYEEPEVD